MADDLKAAKAHQVYRDMGVITDEHIAAELGLDIEDVYAQQKREIDLRATYGLPDREAGGPRTTGLETEGEPQGEDDA